MKKIVKYALVLVGVLPFLTGCYRLMEDKDVIDARYEEAIDPSVNVSLGTLSVSDYVNITIPVTINDTLAVVDFGAMYSKSTDFSNATTLGATTVGEDGKKLFTSSVTVKNLEEETTYYVKAYAYTPGGYIFSDVKSIKTEDAPEPDTWSSLGYALYRDDFLTALFGVSNLEYEVEMLENDQNPGFYRLVNPYGEAYGYNDPGDWDDSQDYYMEIHAEDPTAVYISTFYSGVDWGKGEMIMASLAGLYIERGSMTLEEAKAAGYTGTLEGGIITFPAKALLFGMADYNDGALYYANADELFRVVMPGVVLADYTIGIEYAGLFASKDGGISAVVDLTYEGPDVTDVALALVEGKDPEVAVDLIEAEDESVVTVSEAGEVKIPFAEDAEAGFYTVVAVPVDGNGAYDWEFAVYETFAYGEVDPLYLGYTSDDFVARVSKDDLFNTEWLAYAAGMDGSPSDREACAWVTFEEQEDESDDVDLISVSGLAYTSAFDDTFSMEWYNGILYTLYNGSTATWSSYDLYPLTYSENYLGTRDYTMCGAYVADGLIALVNNSSSDEYYGFGWWAYSGDTLAGYLIVREYLLLIDPDVYESESEVKAAVASLKAGKTLVPARANGLRSAKVSPRDWSKDVVASGKVSRTYKVDKTPAVR